MLQGRRVKGGMCVTERETLSKLFFVRIVTVLRFMYFCNLHLNVVFIRRNDSGGSSQSAFEPLLANGAPSQLVPK